MAGKCVPASLLLEDLTLRYDAVSGFPKFVGSIMGDVLNITEMVIFIIPLVTGTHYWGTWGLLRLPWVVYKLDWVGPTNNTPLTN